MSIVSLQLQNFKSIKNSEIAFRGNMSGIYGPNGSGKTSIIEALDIMKLYFDISKPREVSENLKNTILEKMRIGSDETILTLFMALEDYEYKITMKINKSISNDIYVSEEKFEYRKQGNNKLKFKQLAVVRNSEDDLIPAFYLGKSEKDYFALFNEKILAKNKVNQKDLLLKFNNLNSMLSQIYLLTKNAKEEITNDKMMDFFAHFKKIFKVLNMMMVVTLKEQAMYNLGILIPVKIHNEHVHGTTVIKYHEDANVYDARVLEGLLSVIDDIKPFFSTIIPDSELIVETETVATNAENEKKISMRIFVEKDGMKIPLERESTGTIKLFSILSALIYYVKDENAVVLIDELDIHIFEYVLSIILDVLSQNAKGQLIFTGHNLLPLERLSKDAIIISNKNDEGITYEYLKNSSGTSNLRSKYLKSQAMYSEENIEPLLINESLLKMFVGKLVKE